VLISPLPPPTPVRPRSTPAYPPPGTQLVAVPRVIGLGLYVAEDRLRASGLVVGSVSVTHSADIPGAVVQQSPRDGTSVQTGTTVNLVVAQP
jgi:beta-lactam-binding protein with PASTA domain